jgi:hypothetical protein
MKKLLFSVIKLDILVPRIITDTRRDCPAEGEPRTEELREIAFEEDMVGRGGG